MRSRLGEVMSASFGRILGVALRHWYLLRGSWPRIVSLMYWPIVQLLIWGFVTQFLAERSDWLAQAFGVLIAGVLLWDIVFRSQIGVSMAFMEEMWSRNLAHLFASPLAPWEWASAMTFTSVIRTFVGATPAVLLSGPIFGFSLFELGLPFFGFFLALLLFGWAMGLAVISVIFRQGQGAEELAWAVVFVMAPLCCVYYPVDTLPGFIQPIALALTPTHVFEGMRAIVIDGRFDAGALASAFALNAVYLSAAFWFFLRTCAVARNRGLALRQGE